jgi:hypothetical protein
VSASKQGRKRFPIWLVVLLAVLALPTGLVGLIVYQHYVPHLLLNETTRHLYQYRNIRERFNGPSLVPGLFVGGEPKAQVEAQLLRAGLEKWNIAGDRIPEGAVSLQIFYLGAGMQGLVCGSQLFVKVGYDQNDRLTSATVEQGGACL